MKTIILYANRNVGLAALCYLKAKGYDVMVITEDENVEWMARRFGIPVLPNIGYIKKISFDLCLCVHGKKIIPKECLVENKMVNIHPCLYKYKGHNPIKRYIFGQDTDATIEAQWLIEEVDGGDVIWRENFKTPICNNYADFYNVALIYYYKCLEQTLKILGI